MDEQLETIGEPGFFEPAEEEIKISFPAGSRDFSVNTVDGCTKIVLDGKVPAWCRKVAIEITIAEVEIILTRYRVKGYMSEDDYWKEA